MKNEIAREISYASSGRTRAGRAMIRALENATGRIGLIRRAQGYENEVASGRDFWQVMVDRYGLSLDVTGGSLGNIPANGPLALVANHPYGILDGMIMGYLLSVLRGDFRIIAHRIFRKAEELNRVILPINFDETREATLQNLETRATALQYLKMGGAIGIFPGGTVATAAKPFARPMDPVWRNFTARMIAKSDATVVPIYFEGQNSRLFQLASHINYNLRLAFLIREFRARIDDPVRLIIGEPIPRAQLEPFRTEPKQMMDFLRRTTYDLAPGLQKPYGYGFEFEDKYRIRA